MDFRMGNILCIKTPNRQIAFEILRVMQIPKARIPTSTQVSSQGISPIVEPGKSVSFRLDDLDVTHEQLGIWKIRVVDDVQCDMEYPVGTPYFSWGAGMGRSYLGKGEEIEIVVGPKTAVKMTCYNYTSELASIFLEVWGYVLTVRERRIDEVKRCDYILEFWTSPV